MSAARRRPRVAQAPVSAPVSAPAPAPATPPARDRLPRHLNLVRVRLLNSGQNPTVGVTIPAAVLSACGFDLGDRVYVLVENEGRLVVERAGRNVVGGVGVGSGLRGRDRSDPVLLTPAEKEAVRDELTERVRSLEAEAMQQQVAGNKKAARMRFGKADRLLRLARKFGGGRR